MDAATVDGLPGGPELARFLGERSEELIAGYEARLTALGIGTQDPPVLRFCVAQARAVLADVLLALLNRGSPPGARSTETDPATAALPPELSPLEWNPHDAQRAVLALFDVIMATMTRSVGDRGGGPQMVAAGAVCLHHSIMTRFQVALETKVRTLLHETARAYEEDRRSVSRDLHDRVGYAVSVAKQNLELSELYRPRASGVADDKLRVAHQALHEALDEVRELASGLRSFDRSDGLERALHTCVAGIRTSDAEVSIKVTGHEGWVPPEALDDLFLALREALRNSFAHAKARSVSVHVDIAPHQVHALVTDDGVGFDPGGVPDGVGLACMRERVERRGGTVTVSGFPGHGVTVEFQLPVRRE